MNILVTGASGFIGGQLIESLSLYKKFTPVGAVRFGAVQNSHNIKTVTIDGLGPENSWGAALKNIDVVVHTAARVHVMKDCAKDPLSEYRKINVEGTLNLARQAALSGVKRFIFLSSIKVNGESTPLNHPFIENDTPLPVDPYGISKYETEQKLFEFAKSSGMEIVCIRPPLVYGPGVKANFLTMMKWLNRNIPLPLGAIHNKRSLVALNNLVDFIIVCVDHPAAANQVFFVSDGEDLSTSELLKKILILLRKNTLLLPVNQRILEFLLKFFGKKDKALRLFGSLQVDISKAKSLLGWSPRISVNDGLRETVQRFLSL